MNDASRRVLELVKLEKMSTVESFQAIREDLGGVMFTVPDRDGPRTASLEDLLFAPLSKIIEAHSENLRTWRKTMDAHFDAAKCRGCGQRIWWVRTKNNDADGRPRRAPISRNGVNHFADCPKSKDFRGDNG